MVSFGRLLKEDLRDHAHLMVSKLDPSVPVRRRERMYRTGPVMDQGEQPYCVEYGWNQWLASALEMTAHVIPVGTLYSAARRLDPIPDPDGSTVRGGALAIRELNRLTEFLWAFDSNHVLAWMLANKGGVVLGSLWTRSMMETNVHGTIIPSANPIVEGGHCTFLCGYSESRGAFRGVNSWGTGWGDRGRFWLPGEELDWLLSRDGEACTATEKRQHGA